MKLLNVLKDVTCLHTDVDDQKGYSYRRKSTFLPYHILFKISKCDSNFSLM